MKQVFIKSGEAIIEKVPTPKVGSRHLLVEVRCSCVSVGTEAAGAKLSAMPLYKRALKQPENVKLAFQMMQKEGIPRTVSAIRGMMTAGTTVGYSAAGEVLQVGSEVEGFKPGDRVACAGAGVANHAECINVPVNLAAKIPDSLGFKEASTVALGAIALQGIRRLAPTLGETIAILGLGFIGQLVSQMLKNNGCRILGTDLDSKRVETALKSGMDRSVDPSPDGFVRQVILNTDGFGADGVIIAAATATHDVISQAMQACRKKGRVVLVGDVGLNLKRHDFYAKEIDFLISTSYGPGRYDPFYEEGGQDYPLPYVRWTENRNMETYLWMLAEERIRLDGLVTHEFDIDSAPNAYHLLQDTEKAPMSIILSYPETNKPFQTKITLQKKTGQRGKFKSERIKAGIIGAGDFALGMHLPNLAKLHKQYTIHAVMSRNGPKALESATRYEAKYATTERNEILDDPEVDLVFITTRHDLHGELVCRSLEAGKHVFVEKPLALTIEELNAIEAFYQNTPNGPVLMTGFNRRFSPVVTRIMEILNHIDTPKIINYRMNAGYLPPNHWVHGREGGGRNIGEACHIYDLFIALCKSHIKGVQATSIVPSASHWQCNDNFSATITLTDGSVCNLIYTAMGSGDFPKESMEIYAGGCVITMQDYKKMNVYGSKNKGWQTKTPDKGHFAELEALARCLTDGSNWPISLEEQISVTRVGFNVEAAISN